MTEQMKIQAVCFMGGQSWSYLSTQCAVTRLSLGQLLCAGDDRLIQTYSNAMNPNGSIMTRQSICGVIPTSQCDL